MRSIIKMLGLAFFATLAFSAVGAIGAGSASALLFLTTGGSELFTVLNLNSTAKPAVLESKLGTKVECPSVLGHGLILNKTDEVDKLLFTFHECKSSLGTCTSSGEPSGLVTTLELDALLVTTLTGHYALLILAEKGKLAEFTCGTTKIEVQGTVVGETPESGNETTATTEMKVTFAKNGTGKPAITSYWTLQGTAGPKLESSFGLGFEEASEEAVGDVMTANPVKLCHK